MLMKIQSKTTRVLFLLVLFTGAAIRLLVSWQSIDNLISKNLPDDAFYYFVIARNVVQSGSVSLDGINATNGFHPLWLILLLPIFAWNTSLGDLQVHLALSLGSMLDIVTMWGVFQIVYKLTKREGASIFAMWLYAVNPVVIFQVTNGLETALFMALLALFIWMVIEWLTSEHRWRYTVSVGLLGGFTFLARTDSVFFLGFLFIGALFYWGVRSGWKRIFLAGSMSVLVVIPWLVWSRIVVGSWMQVSGVAVPFAIMKRINVNETGSMVNLAVREAVNQIGYRTLWLRGDPTGLPLILGLFLWIVVIGLLVLHWKANDKRIAKFIMIPTLMAVAALLIVHAGVRWYPRPWYFIPTALAFAISLGLSINAYAKSGRAIFYTGLFFSVYFVISGYIFWQIGFYPWQGEMLEASYWLETNSPTEERIGSFNAGIYAYFSGRTVVNLDGVVNNNAYEAIRESDVVTFMHHNDIEYLVDYDNAVKNEYAPFMGPNYLSHLEEVAILGDSGSEALGKLRIYRVSEP